MKLDIEGRELDVLTGMSLVISEETNNHVIEQWRKHYNNQTVLGAQLTAAGAADISRSQADHLDEIMPMK